MTKLYIAYGSNIDEEQMEHRCPDAKVVGTAVVENHRLLFKGVKDCAYATIEPEEGSHIPVLVWEINGEDERRLDRYEGYPKFYYKKELPVLVNGETHNAMVYIMDERNPQNKPSYNYYGILERSYIKYGFDDFILKRALEESCS
ncbi:gamma-glutamylcyclotransferase family protein [Clostridium sp. HBUAS56010]|uniref:gamma-glutamylcyclotransferase family protein n=1 Tax=Clostridium sp. HBUAS56010 TaxID=2571127 RepID=UPI001178B96B|nr:gamma-glutamylcyclotransferase family protein [Clostridium sp. HBUAS56010]